MYTVKTGKKPAWAVGIASVMAAALLVLIALEPIIAAAGDADLDGIPTATELSDVYFVEVQAGGRFSAATGPQSAGGIWQLPLPNWNGTPKGGYLNFSVTHNTNRISALIGYKSSSAWVDRVVWDPGRNEVLPEVSVTPANARAVTRVEARVTNGVRATQADFYVNQIFQYSDMTTPDNFVFEWDWNTLTRADGPYSVQVLVRDLVGRTVWSNRTIVVDNTRPVASLTSPTPNSIVSKTVLVKAQVVETNLDRVEFLVGPGLAKADRGTPDCINAYCFNWNTKGWSNGFQDLTVVAYDRAGNDGRHTIRVTVNNPECPSGPCPPDPGVGAIIGTGPGILKGLPVPESVNVSTGTLGAFDSGAGTSTTWGRATGSPVTGIWVQGDTKIISMDLTKETANLTQAQRDAGLLGPGFRLTDFSNTQWRFTLRSWLFLPTDGMLNYARLRIQMGTDPYNPDTDGDGIKDGPELGSIAQTAPFLPDTERDGLSDGAEVNVHRTNPLRWDTDDDGLTDFDEVTQYHLFRVAPVTGSLSDPGTWTYSFTVSLSKAHVVKVEATTVLVRNPAFLSGHDLDDLAYINAQDDLFFGQYLSVTLQRSGVPVSGTINETHGKAEVVVYQNGSVRIEERRVFVATRDDDVAFVPGSHAIVLNVLAAPGSIFVSFLQMTLTARGSTPTDPDTDNDGVKDGREGRLRTSPFRTDTDEDGLWDGWVDDGDLVYETGEAKGEAGNSAGVGGYGTDPARVDTDADGLWDGPNVGSNLGEIPPQTDPLKNDTDEDGLLDGTEVSVHATNPLLKDTDGDTLWDPWELDMGLNPKDGTDGASDSDSDGLTTAQEFPLRTHRSDPDSDDDGLLDGQEVDGVLLRTSVQKGMVTSTYYGAAGEWVAYAGHRYTTTGGSVTNPSASSGANSRKATTRLLAVLDDESHVFRNTTLDELYVWLPGSDHGDRDVNGTGDGVLQGSYYRFTKTATPESGMAKPQAGYYQREFYAGSNPLDPDTDEDGVMDGAEIGWGLDTDGDGLSNRLDRDSDADKAVDGEEADWNLDTDGDGARNMVDSDSDGDGILDGTEALWRNDTDLDGRANMIDTDSDSDGIRDGLEDANKNGTVQALETSPISTDTDGDGLADGVEVNPFADVDSDGFANAHDRDSDADGIEDGNETSPYVDTDGDGILNVYDSDADADGLSDGNEAIKGTDRLKRDTDNDGLCDGPTVTSPSCTGEQAKGTNPLDPDTDRDGLLDAADPNPNSPDGDGDGVWDSAEISAGTSPTKSDTDGDGLCDGWDVTLPSGTFCRGERTISSNPTNANTDAEGLNDGVDPCPTKADCDGDGLTDNTEVTSGSNPLEPDTDGDGLWDGPTMTVNGVTFVGETPTGTSRTNADTDADGVLDGDEVAGWYVYVLRVDGTILERFVTSNPLVKDTDGDGLQDGDEYLRTDPRLADTDGDGLRDTLAWLHPRNVVPSMLDENPIAPEDIPPKLGTIGQSHVLEWGWWGFIPVVVHTWLTLTVTATDNVAVRDVTFRFLDGGATVIDRYNGDASYTGTFEIDFWADYTWGYDVEARASDTVGNIMATQTGGGLQYIIGGIVAKILAFFAGAEMAGGVLGFFMGFAAGLFEDLTIFLHLQEMWDAIQQLPKIIGLIIGDPSILLTMVQNMVDGILAKGNLVNPYGQSTMTAADFANALVKFFWHLFDPSVVVPTFTTADVFNLAFAVSHLAGYFIQQFVVGTGALKIASMLKKADKVVDGLRAVGKAVETAADFVVKTAGKVKNVAVSAVKKLLKGTADALGTALEKLGLKFEDNVVEALLRQAARHGCSGCGIDDLIKKFGKAQSDSFFARSSRRLKDGLNDFRADRQVHALERHSPHIPAGPEGKGSLFPGDWSNEKILNAIEEAADRGTPSPGLGGTTLKDLVIDGVTVRAVLGKVGIITGYKIAP